MHSVASMSTRPAFGFVPGKRSATRCIALLSDDPRAGAAWGINLAAEGLRVCELSANGAVASDSTPQALVLHIERSLTDHLAELRELAARHADLPLIVVCKPLRDLDHVLALEMGADDALDSSTSAAVVAARLRAMWRRSARALMTSDTMPERIHFNGLTLEWRARRVELGGLRVPLTEGEFEVLWLLAMRAGQVVARDDLLRQVRGLPSDETDRSIDNRIYRIRHKLGDRDPTAYRLRTVRNRGYLLSPVGW